MRKHASLYAANLRERKEKRRKPLRRSPGRKRNEERKVRGLKERKYMLPSVSLKSRKALRNGKSLTLMPFGRNLQCPSWKPLQRKQRNG